MGRATFSAGGQRSIHIMLSDPCHFSHHEPRGQGIRSRSQRVLPEACRVAIWCQSRSPHQGCYERLSAREFATSDYSPSTEKSLDAVPSLIKTLKDDIPGVRCSAAWALGKIEDARAVESLIQLLNDRDSDVRTWAANALGSIGDRRAIKPLQDLLKIEKETGVKIRASEALQKLLAK